MLTLRTVSTPTPTPTPTPVPGPGRMWPRTRHRSTNGWNAYFYLNHDASAVRGWYAINEIEQVADVTEYAHSELAVPTNFMALTGIEGQGITLLDRHTQAIYDVAFGEFEQLKNGSLVPLAHPLQAFLRWCKASEDARENPASWMRLATWSHLAPWPARPDRCRTGPLSPWPKPIVKLRRLRLHGQRARGMNPARTATKISAPQACTCWSVSSIGGVKTHGCAHLPEGLRVRGP